MRHIHLGGFFLAILAGLSTLQAPPAQAQTAVGIEQTFADSLTALPTVGSVGNGHYAFISQGRPIRIIKN